MPGAASPGFCPSSRRDASGPEPRRARLPRAAMPASRWRPGALRTGNRAQRTRWLVRGDRSLIASAPWQPRASGGRRVQRVVSSSRACGEAALPSPLTAPGGGEALDAQAEFRAAVHERPRGVGPPRGPSTRRSQGPARLRRVVIRCESRRRAPLYPARERGIHAPPGAGPRGRGRRGLRTSPAVASGPPSSSHRPCRRRPRPPPTASGRRRPCGRSLARPGRDPRPPRTARASRPRAGFF